MKCFYCGKKANDKINKYGKTIIQCKECSKLFNSKFKLKTKKEKYSDWLNNL